MMDNEPYRKDARRDFARLIHCPAFRRLQGKTQLFPGYESDFFRNRLTHSLEVAQVAKSIATRINYKVREFEKNPISTDIVETAALAHDLGHPPFGHNGEKALDELMKGSGGFEGNAQTLRILSKLEKKETFGAQPRKKIATSDQRVGLNLTARTLAAILKYDNKIPSTKDGRKMDGVHKGYYDLEAPVVEFIKHNVIRGDKNQTLKTIECQIMDIADDIAYSTYDLEDAFKAGFLSPMQIISSGDDILNRVSAKVRESIIDEELKQIINEEYILRILINTFRDIFPSEEIKEIIYQINNKQSIPMETDYTVMSAMISSTTNVSSLETSKSGYLRTSLTSQLVGEFIRGIGAEYNGDEPALSQITINPDVKIKIEILKHYTFETIINSPMLKVVEYKGKDIVKQIFCALDDGGSNLLPEDYKRIYDNFSNSTEKKRTICDFIAGMTDRYAIEFWRRLYASSHESIFKPL